MEIKKISQEELNGLIAVWQKERTVYAPVKDGTKYVFDRIDTAGDVCWDYGNSQRSPKEFFFPRSEVMFKYHRKERGMEVVQNENQTEQRVLLGIRPCDAQGLAQLDMVFDQDDYKDPYFIKRRRNTAIVSYACTEPCTTCFCSSLGGGPFSERGADLQLVNTGDGYLLKVLTDKGAGLLAGQNLTDADTATTDHAAALQVAAEKDVDDTLPADELTGILNDGFNHPQWDEIHRKCIACGLCTFFCSTCHCFDIMDEATDAGGTRIRNWDSCMFPQFTAHTSGHNPRDTQKERWRQRLMHKFSYTVKNFDEKFCTGCGRCIINCPVNLDVREVIRGFTKS